MSTPEQPASPALTRKQMRDIRNTGATPIVTADAPSEAPPAGESTARPRHPDAAAPSLSATATPDAGRTPPRCRAPPRRSPSTTCREPMPASISASHP